MSNYPEGSNGESPYIMNAEEEERAIEQESADFEEWAYGVLDSYPLPHDDINRACGWLRAVYGINKATQEKMKKEMKSDLIRIPPEKDSRKILRRMRAGLL